jgi:hypothetical protein
MPALFYVQRKFSTLHTLIPDEPLILGERYGYNRCIDALKPSRLNALCTKRLRLPPARCAANSIGMNHAHCHPVRPFEGQSRFCSIDQLLWYADLPSRASADWLWSVLWGCFLRILRR